MLLEREEIGIAWKATLSWSIFLLSWYFLLQTSLKHVVSPDELARETLFAQVPLYVYMYSQAAFFTATILNLISFIFEDTAEKKQLALLSAIIKGISCHCDHLIVTGQAVVKFDRHGALLLPSRYVQWSCSTPTMIFTLSRISDLSGTEVALAMLADWLMVVAGYVAAEMPWYLAVFPAFVSFAAFAYVLHELRRMIYSALKEANTNHAKACLNFTLWSTVVVWNLFWVAWIVARCGERLGPLGEPLTIFCNFAAKVIFSSTIMYNNYMTIAQRRRIVQQQREHAERLQTVRDLGSAVTSKDEFLAVVGHELRTPLNAIIQLSRAMARGAGGPLLEQGRSWMETITSSATHLLAIVNDIIIVQAARAGSLQLRQEVVDVGAMLDQVMRTTVPMAKRSIVLEKMLHERVPPIIADRRRLLQVMNNLVGNALKFTDKGKVTVKAYPDKGARHLVIKVVDQGCGIPRDKLLSIFEAFKQADMTATRRYGGVGLGLSIAKELVNAHNGSISVHSDGVGRGTAVVVRLPVLQPENEAELEELWRRSYEALGYKAADLLSPELAMAEGRFCPVFQAKRLAGRLLHEQHQMLRQHSLMPRPSNAPPSPNPYVPSPLQPKKPERNSLSEPPLHTKPTLALPKDREPLLTHHPSGSHSNGAPVLGYNPASASGNPRVASLDMQHAMVDRYRWSGDSGQSSGDNTVGSKDGEGAAGAHGGSDDGEFHISAGSSIPGTATALMSSLYAPPDEDTSAASGLAGGLVANKPKVASAHAAGAAKPGALPHLPPASDLLHLDGGRPSPAGSHQMSGSMRMFNEEDSESRQLPTPDGASSSAPSASASVGGASSTQLPSTTTTKGGAAQTGTESGTSAGSSQVGSGMAHMYEEAYLRASGVVTAAAEAERAAELAQAQAQGKAGDTQGPEGGSSSGPPAPTGDEWASFAGKDGGVFDRSQAPAVQANQKRLSQQYELAVAEAAHKKQPLKPEWQAWVARIPEHHRKQ